jgi:uncharacterized membrane protein
MKHISRSGSALAAAALTLAAGFVAFTAAPSQAGGENDHCYGVNACKGQASCKSLTHSCKGQNACKGRGWVNLNADECTKRGGMIIE